VASDFASMSASSPIEDLDGPLHRIDRYGLDRLSLVAFDPGLRFRLKG
jgi:hypothetical protein